MKEKINILKDILKTIGYERVNAFQEINKDYLEILSTSELHTSSKFELVHVRDSYHGRKAELMARNVYYENMNIATLSTEETTVFDNCIFDNVKFKKCKLNRALFINCKFINSSFVQSSLEDGYFVNCIGLENTQMIDNRLKGTVVLGSRLDKTELEENSNIIRDMHINENNYQVESRSDDSYQLLEKTKRSNNNMGQNLISKKEFVEEVLTVEKLKNHLFNDCHFISCTFEKNIFLDASSDFIDCHFEDMSFIGRFDKVTFDQSEFQNVIFDGNFTRCSFVRSRFELCQVAESSNFYTCNFDFSNAYEKFEKYQEQFTGVIFNSTSSCEEISSLEKQIFKKMKPIYNLMKSFDKDLQEQLKKTEEISDEIIDEYFIGLNDLEFTEFISRITYQRLQCNKEIEIPKIKDDVI